MVHGRSRFVGLLTGLFLLAPSLAVTPPGLVYESEKISQPEDGWKLNQMSADRWQLWTNEEDIERKRSGGAVLTSPVVKADRATPAEGAPPLHSVVTDLAPGSYRVVVSAPGGRPLAWSLDGQTWQRYEGGELDLGVRELPAGRFELWIDDRYAHPPGNPGPAYYDYVRFVPVPRSAAAVRRHSLWRGLDAWLATANRGRAIPASSLALSGFTVEGGERIVGTAPPAHFSYTFPAAGVYHVGLTMTDDVDGAENLRVTLGGREIATILADGGPEVVTLFALKEPLAVKAGEVLDFAIQTPVGAYRVDHLILSRDPIEPPAPKIEHLAAWSPEAGIVHLCWTTTVAAPTGRVEYRATGEPVVVQAPANSARNHRVVLSGLNPETTYTGQIVTTLNGAELRAGLPAFRAAPPRAPASSPQTIELRIPEPTGAARSAWPAVIGLPFGRGKLARPEDLRLLDPRGVEQPLQADVFSRWPDGSLKWVTLSFVADTQVGTPLAYRLEVQPGRATAAGAGVTIRETAEAWQVSSPSVAFEIGKRLPALFARLGYDRNGDGQVADDERLAAAPLGANVKLETAEGGFLTCGPPEAFEVEENGPSRAVLRWQGPLVEASGAGGWRYLLRVTLWRGRTGMTVNLSVINDQPEPRFRAISALALRVPLDAVGGVRGGLEGAAPAPVPDADGWWLHQAHDNRYTLRGPDGLKQGERATGVAVAEDQQARVTVTMRDFPQTYPSGLAVKPDGVHVRLLPPLAPDTYADAESQKWFMQLYPWFRDGKYLVRAGQLIQGEIYVDYGRPGIGDAARLAAWQQQPLLPLAPPSYLMETAVLGRAIFPRTAGVWDSYEQYFDRGFEATEQDRQRQRSFGWMHYGDWYGERGFNYGNNEYDLPWAVGLQWLRSGDRRLFDRGQQMARHYSTTDTVHGRFSDSWNGLVFEHSFNHIGVDLKPDDPRMQKGEYADYLQRYGASMFQGAIDRQGHVFQAGNWLYAALTGDRFLRDVAARVSLNQAEKLTPRFDFSIERAGGWPLINMTMAHAFTGNPYYLNAARLMIERTLDRQDPATGGWLHRPPADEVDGEQVLGGKAFAVGILTHGILRYLEQEPESRPEVAAMLVRGVDWLMNESWNPGKGFRYISNARTYANSGGRGGTSLLNAEAVAFAYEQTKDPKYLAFWRDMMQAQLDGSPGGMGKGFAMAVRQTVYGLDRVRAYGINEAPRQATVLLRERAELRDGQAAVRVAVDNPAGQPRTVTARVISGAAPAEVRWAAVPGTFSLGPALRLAATRPGEVVVEIDLQGSGPARRTVKLEPPAPAVPAARGRGLAYVGPVESTTRRALRASGHDLPCITEPAKADLARYAGLIIASDSWKSPTVDLPGAVDAFVSFVRAGGRIAIWQINDDSWKPGWLPADLFAFDEEGMLGAPVASDHPLLKELGAGLAGAMMYDTLGPVDEPWRVLASDSAGRPAIVEASFGLGRVVVIEPSIDRYAAGNGDEPDGRVTQAAAQRFMVNLLAYLQE